MGMGIGMDDVMTIILGAGDPCEPGMHGPCEEPKPSEDAVGIIMKIRDMCDKWLMSAGKQAEQPSEPELGDGEEE